MPASAAAAVGREAACYHPRMLIGDTSAVGAQAAGPCETGLEEHADVAALLSGGVGPEPVYCLYPRVLAAGAAAFLEGFPGRVLYAVKANDHPAVIRVLNRAGVSHFDCASLEEIEGVRRQAPDATCYFMVPVRRRGAARAAFETHGVRHFMVDHADGINALAAEIDFTRSVVFVRMAVSHEAALQDLSSKFGAPAEDVPALLAAVRARCAEPALAFNVGSSVTRPDAYVYAIGRARAVLEALPFPIRLLDIGGGFPQSYPGFDVPPLAEFFEAIAGACRGLPLSPGGLLMAEPGRALSAPGLSAVVEVLLRKGERLYLNDGMYGIFWELRFKGHKRFPVRAFRKGSPLAGPCASFELYGPTCDATDVLPGRVELPQTIGAGDHLEFGAIGAYSLAGRTHFNGLYSDRVVSLTGSAARPPGCDADSARGDS